MTTNPPHLRRRSWRRALAGAGVLSLTALAACTGGSDTGESQDTDTITFHTSWTNGEPRMAKLQEIIDAFTAETGIQVEVLQNDTDEIIQVYETALLAGEEADILLSNLEANKLDWVSEGAVVPVTDHLDEWGLTELLPAEAIDAWTDEDGNVRAVPYIGYTWPMWFNTALLAEAGIDEVPTTYDDLLAAIEALSAAGITPMAIGGSDWSGQKLVMLLSQLYTETDETEELFTSGGFCSSPGAMQGLEVFAELRDAGLFSDGVEGLTAEQTTALYLNGDAAMGFILSTSYEDADETLVEDTVLGGFPLPDGAVHNQPIAYQGLAGGGFWISPNGAEKIDEVGQFVQYMFEDDSLATLIDHTGTVAIAPVSEEAAAAAGNGLVQRALTDLPDAVEYVVMPDLYVPADVNSPLYRATGLAFTAGFTAEQICAELDAAYASAQ